MARPAPWRVAIAVVTLWVGLTATAETSAEATNAITVSGNVAQTLSLSVADLKRYPAHHIELPDSSGEKATGSVRRYTGCLLRDILTAAKPVESKPRELRRSYVVATASDGYEVVFSWAELFISAVGDTVFVVYERDGAALADGEGRIALIVTSDTRPARHVKWLQTLTLRAA